MTDLISIIVPVYNCEKYVHECIESLLLQTYKNFEVLLINDGSSDNSYSICKQYEERDNRICVYSHNNIGVAKTRERGYDLSKGKYIVYVDSDDRLEPDFLEILLQNIIDEDADVVCCNSIDDGIINKAIEFDELISDRAALMKSFLDGKRYAYCIWAKMYRKEILSGITFKPLKYAEDTYYVSEVFNKSKRVKLISYAGYHYRNNVSGAMRTSKGIQQEKDVLVLLGYIKKLCELNYIQYIETCNKRIGICLFNLIIRASVEDKKTRIEAINILKSFVSQNDGLLDCSNLKNTVVFLFDKFPGIMMAILRIYKKYF